MEILPEHRLRFVDFAFTDLPGGRFSAKVEFDRATGDTYVGAASGSGSETVRLRCAADAAIAALNKAAEARYSFIFMDASFELIGAKEVTAFDGSVIIVGVKARHGDYARRLVGSSSVDGDRERAAVRAVLDATNRFLARVPFPFALDKDQQISPRGVDD